MTKRILIIDDDQDIQDVAKVALEVVGGWEVMVADSGKQGLAIATSSQPDLILLDIMMPDMDGVTTLKLLRADPDTAKIPVILLTAKVLQSDRQQFTTLDITAVIPKPFKTMLLAAQIAEIMDWQA